jgi:hypothetical protein
MNHFYPYCIRGFWIALRSLEPSHSSIHGQFHDLTIKADHNLSFNKLQTVDVDITTISTFSSQNGKGKGKAVPVLN